MQDVPDVSLAKEKVKNSGESSGLSSVAPHYFRGGPPALLVPAPPVPAPRFYGFFFFFGLFAVIEAQTDQEMQIIPSSEDAQ